jgi:hypothetical protein
MASQGKRRIGMPIIAWPWDRLTLGGKSGQGTIDESPGVPGVDTIDTSMVNTSFLGYSYYDDHTHPRNTRCPYLWSLPS